jgi:hypothetical protein
MKICEVVQHIEELSPAFVNQQAEKQKWQMQGRGFTSSVWSHFSDPDTVVKLVGGGTHNPTDFHDQTNEHRIVTLAFIHCCVDHGKKNKHLPNILGINVDDEEVLQVRMERLLPLPDNSETGALGRALGELDRAVNSQGWREPILQELEQALQDEGLDRYQDAEELFNVVVDLNELKFHYGKLHRVNLSVDLHSNNWMMHPNGTIVAVDPWI